MTEINNLRNRIELSDVKPGDLFLKVDNRGAARHLALSLHEVSPEVALKIGQSTNPNKLICVTTLNLKSGQFNYLRYWIDQDAKTAYYLIQKPDGA